MSTKSSSCQAPVVAVINMKGGVGKTTIAGNLFREIFRTHGIRTLLVDFDAQFNLSQLLLSRNEYEELRARKKTIAYVLEPEIEESVYHTSVSATITSQDIDDFSTKLKYMQYDKSLDLRLVPGDFRLAMLNLQENAGLLGHCRKRFANFVSQARSACGLVVLDCNPSSSFLTRCALEASTHLLVPVRPDKYSILGVEMLYEYIKTIPTLRQDLEKSIVVNGSNTTPEAQRIVAQIRGHVLFGPSVLEHTIPQSGVLAARSDFAGFAVDRRVSWTAYMTSRLRSVGTEYAKLLGIVT